MNRASVPLATIKAMPVAEFVLKLDADQLNEIIEALRHNVEEDPQNNESIRLLGKLLDVQNAADKAAREEI